MTTYLMNPLPGRTANPPGVGESKALKCVTGQFSLTAALALGDVMQSPVISAGSTIVDVMLVTSKLDTNGTPLITLDVGNGTTPSQFIAASTVGETGGVARATAITAQPLTLPSDDTIDVTVHAAPATGAVTGTVTLHVFFLPPNA